MDRRTFFQRAATAVGAAQVSLAQKRAAAISDYPRVYSGAHLKMIAFPLGGVGAGSVSLGGRGQLRDWEIFHKSTTGFSPNYALPSIWARSGN
ncbi:MAG: GH116 family glycosyl-hydrolase, partial [Bryobacteraceae bacterium]